ncbi:MAG: aminotransferase class I/II-fold pyridoxal phosphate-dependent enzyme [Porphyrobacter sp.]|nr:aminotransferase class I/II-fold pyridoxal phosphate-dependent enzyme [Porphyrobacter sp.]
MKRAATGTEGFGLGLTLPDRAGPGGLVRDIHRQLREAIVAGRLAPGLQLPSNRGLARSLGVSRNTVAAIYDLLFSEGLIEAHQGAGTFVSMSQRPAKRRGKPPFPLPRLPTRPVPEVGLLAGALPAGPGILEMRVGIPDQSAVPWDVWRRLSALAIRQHQRAPAIIAPAAGLYALREAVAMHLSFARAIACAPERIVVTSGVQGALDLLARTLVVPGKTVIAVEDPGYPAARAPFVLAGARVVPVPVDSEGILVDAIPAEASLVYVTPSHQFPTGSVMSMARRRALLARAAKTGALILEDDYDSEFRYGDQPLDALQTLDRDQVVVYLGIFSKSLFPGLRLGFMVAPEWLRPTLIDAFRAGAFCTPLIPQATLAAFISEGHLARHIRRMRRIYGSRRAALHEAIDRHLGPQLSVMPSSAGLHLSVAVAPDLSLDRLACAGTAAGVAFHRLDAMALAPPPIHAIGIGFGQCPEDCYDAAMAQLASHL